MFLVVSTSAIDCLERLVSEMTCYVSSGTLNPTHSLTLGVGCVFVVLRLWSWPLLPTCCKVNPDCLLACFADAVYPRRRFSEDTTKERRRKPTRPHASCQFQCQRCPACRQTSNQSGLSLRRRRRVASASMSYMDLLSHRISLPSL